MKNCIETYSLRGKYSARAFPMLEGDEVNAKEAKATVFFPRLS